MAENNFTNQEASGHEIRNGFQAVSRLDIECITNITYEQSMSMAAFFKAIGRLSNDETIKALCAHGALQAELQGNDLDVLQENMMKAGLVGENGVSLN